MIDRNVPTRERERERDEKLIHRAYFQISCQALVGRLFQFRNCKIFVNPCNLNFVKYIFRLQRKMTCGKERHVFPRTTVSRESFRPVERRFFASLGRAVFRCSFSVAHVKRSSGVSPAKTEPALPSRLIFTRPKATVNIRGLRTENNANSVNISKL